MRQGTKRYFCGGCGAVVDGPGRYCDRVCQFEVTPYATCSKEQVLENIDKAYAGLASLFRLSMNPEVARAFREIVRAYPYDDVTRLVSVFQNQGIEAVRAQFARPIALAQLRRRSLDDIAREVFEEKMKAIRIAERGFKGPPT